MKSLRFIDNAAFFVTVAAGAVAAIAGGNGWAWTSVAAGCVAAIAPVANRIVSGRLSGPRRLSPRQVSRLVTRLSSGHPFKLQLAHNRHEAEPAALHAQLFEGMRQAGLDVAWFGGMTNSTVGIEISGPDSPDKRRLMDAFNFAGIPFLNIAFTEPGADTRGIEVWVGVNPGH